jgi:hypothetical protein
MVTLVMAHRIGCNITTGKKPMYRWITHHLFLVILLLGCHPLHASTDHFWLLQEYGVEKRAMSDGSLIQEFASLTKPLAFSVKPKQHGIWAIADGFLLSFDADGNILKSSLLDNINQNAYLLSMPENGVWLFHGAQRFAYNQQLELTETLELPVNGNQINDVTYNTNNSKTWLTTTSSVIAIDNAGIVTTYELEKNEKINGITTSKEGDVALIVSTPKPEYRLYTPDFEHITTHQLYNVSPAPENLVETKEGQYWLAGKQHILLLDSDEGIVINQQHNGDIPQGPGESQLVVNNKDNSAWISTGRTLIHIDTAGIVQQELMEPQRNIDLENDNNLSSAPALSPGTLKATQLSYPIVYFQSESSTSFFDSNLARAGKYYYFSFDATDDDGDIDYSSFTATRSGTSAQIDISSPGTQLFAPWGRNFPLTCYRGSVIAADNPQSNLYPWLVGGSEDRITCHIHIYFSSLSQGTTDEEIQLFFQISDREGNESSRALASIHIDRTPPTFNPDLISIDIDNTNHTATISGTSGSVEPESMVAITYIQVGNVNFINLCWSNISNIGCLHSNRIRTKSTETGGFTITLQLNTDPHREFTIGYGDDIAIFGYDYSLNLASPTRLTIGRGIELSHTSNTVFKRGGTLKGTHTITDINQGHIDASYSINGTITYVPVTLSANTYSLDIKDINPTYIAENEHLPIYLEAREGNDAYGQNTIYLYFDKTPPFIPKLWGPFVEHTDGFLTISCNEEFAPCAEPGSTLHITNNSNNKSVSVEVDENGLFTATIAGENGSSFTFIAEDASGNTSQPLQKNIGRIHSLDLHISETTYYRTREFDQISVTINPASSQKSTVTINGVTATPQEGYAYRYIARDVTIGEDNTVTAIYKDPYGGYGRVEMKLLIDTTPPDKINLELLEISTAEAGFYNMTCADGCAEPGSLILIEDLSTGTTTFATATETGSFTARSYSSINQRLKITVEDQAHNQSVVEILTNYDINVVITSHKDGDFINTGKVFVTGYHNGPPNSVVTSYYGEGEFVTDGNKFSGYAEIQPLKAYLGIKVNGPLNGSGSEIIILQFIPSPPKTELITQRHLPDYEGKYVVLIGAPGAVDGYSKLDIINNTTNDTGWLAPNPDGSFEFTVPARNGDIFSFYSVSSQGYKSDSVILPIGRLVDLTVISHQNGSIVGSQPITVTGTHAGPDTSTITVNGINAQVTAGEFTASNVTVGGDGILNIRLDSYTDAYGIATIQLEVDSTPPTAPNLDLITTAFSAGNHVHVSGQPGSVEGGATLTITNTAQNISKTVTVADDGSFSTYLPGVPGEGLSLAATDAVGNQGEAATLVLGSEAMITIDSPYEGAIIPALVASNGNLTGLVNVTGSHNGPVNSGIVVNGVVAAVTADQFVALNVPVAEDGIITAKLTALNGRHGTVQLSVGLNEQPYRLSLTPSSTEGMAPHSVSFDWNAYTAETPTEVSIDYDGDGVYDQNSSDLTTPLQHNYTAAGISNVTLRITMADGSFHTAETVVVTHGSDHYDAIFLSLWDGMNGALLGNEPGIALKYLTPPAQLEYAKTFQVIAPHMQAIIDSYGPSARSDIKRGYLEYIIERTYLDSTQAHYIYSLQGKDGMWRLSTM